MTVLAVRHGVDRGRMDNYLEPVFEELRARGVGDAVRVHETGNSAPSLDGITAIAFLLADPLREWYPACYAEATAIAADARSRGLQIVNPPEALSNTIKTRQSSLWREAGFETPRWIRFEDDAGLQAALEETGFPVIIRADETHGQGHMKYVHQKRDLLGVGRGDYKLPGALSRVHDIRVGFRERDPSSIYAQLHHKKRAWVLGERVVPEDINFSERPIVSTATDIFGREDYWLPALQGLVRLRRLQRIAVREDIAYWRNGEPQAGTLVAATQALGLSFAAIDYSELADGRLLLWEANAHPYFTTELRMPWPRRSRPRVAEYRRGVADFLLRLAGTE